MKKLPVFVSDFKEMITENYLYIDKTQFIYPLVKEKGFYFLSRPRRFGKSLLVSTLRELLAGNKKLFENLWIAKSDYQWHEYPIVDLDFSRIAHNNTAELEKSLSWGLQQKAKEYNIDGINKAPNIPAQLQLLVEELAKKNKVVILIDEYDKPILDHIHNLEEARKQQVLLHSFYSTIKSLNRYIHSIFITGVTKFARTSVFSGMNNVQDISLHPLACQLLGYTHHEVETYFNEQITDCSKTMNYSRSELLQKLQNWYNGYRFCQSDVKVYNPFSILYFFHNKNFNNYWFKSGTPTFLVEVLRQKYQEALGIEDNRVISKQGLERSFEISDVPLLPLLFETGYFTIKEYDDATQFFTLDYPNAEVRESFKSYLLAAFTFIEVSRVESLTQRLITALDKHDIEQFCSILQTLFAQVPYQLHSKRKEADYHIIFQIIFSMLGTTIQSEVSTNKGRIDAVIITAHNAYIFEIKTDTPAEIALQQIEERKYYQKYLHQGKNITLIGLAFNTVNNALDLDFAIKNLEQ